VLRASCSMVVDDPGPVDIAPAAQITFPSDHQLHSAVFSPDGSSLYAHVVVPAIDLWPILASFWPEALGGLFGLFTLFALWRWRVVAGRRRERGASYCRGCNYEVTGLGRERAPDQQDESAVPTERVSPASIENSPLRSSSGAVATLRKCPECGKDLSSAAIVPGRSSLQRLRWLGAIWLIAALGYSSLFVFKVPRQGALSHWSSWCRKDLADWATRKQNKWLVSKITECDRIIELDPATCEIRRVVTTLPSQTYFNPGISPDGRFLFLGSKDSNSISCVNVAGGSIHRTARLPGSPTVMVNNPAVIGFSPDGACAYIQWHNNNLNTSGVSAWDIATNRVISALDVPAYQDTRSGRAASWPRHFFVRFDDAGTPIFLSFPDFMESFPSSTYIVRIYEAGRDTREFVLTPSPDPSSAPAWCASDQLLIAVSQYGRGLSGWSLVDGSTLGEVASMEMTTNLMGSIAHDDQGRFLAMGFSDVLNVRDAVAKRWLARLRCPPDGYGARTLMTSDGAWCAAVFQTGKPSGRSGVPMLFELATWRLNALERARQYEETTKGK
jgi:hypothetical protein